MSQHGPEDVDAAFAEIVAGLRREGDSPQWPDEVTAEPDVVDKDEPPAKPEEFEPREVAELQDERVPRHGGTPTETLEATHSGREDDHFVPPEPPPLPPMRPATIGSLLMFCIGALLLIAPGVIGLNSSTGLTFAVLAFAGGIGWLVLRMRQGPPPDSGWDDGAQL